MAGGLDALLAGTTTVIDHHASPNFIDGSLDVIADALAELGLRSVLCYEVTDRDGAERAAAGLKRTSGSQPHRRPLARGMIGAHASFTLSDPTLEACAARPPTPAYGVHIHVAEDAADQADAAALHRCRVVQRLSRGGRGHRARRCSRTACTSTTGEARDHRRVRRDGRAQRPQQHEQRRRAQPGDRRLLTPPEPTEARRGLRSRRRRPGRARHRRHRRRHDHRVAGGVLPGQGGEPAHVSRPGRSPASRPAPRRPAGSSASRCSAASRRARPPTSWCSTTPPRRR